MCKQKLFVLSHISLLKILDIHTNNIFENTVREKLTFPEGD